MTRPASLFFRILLGTVVALVIAATVLWFGGRAWLGRSVAVENGTIGVAELQRPVEITFDAKGIPQIWADSDGDALFGLGWVHASERLFQMELIRRLAEGRLAELFGAAALPVDREQRRLGFERRARRDLATLDPHTRALTEQYVAGINAWLAQRRLLPPEFLLLRAAPTKWTVEDVAAIALYQSWFNQTLMDRNRAYGELIARLGPVADSLLSRHVDWSPGTVEGAAAQVGLGGVPHWAMTLASNSWAVAPSRSASGRALHASDPHLEIDRAPVLWYAAGLHSREGLDAVGVTAPGIPIIIMGHNAAAAWSFTTAPVDLTDEYIERFRRSPRLESLTPHGWEPVRVDTEMIAVKGAAVESLVVWETPRGVVTQHDDTIGVSLHWAGFDFPATELMVSGFALMRADGFAEFRHAVTHMGGLSVNWIYSDSAGHIGYQLGAPLPRRGFDTFLRHPGLGHRVRLARLLPGRQHAARRGPRARMARQRQQPAGGSRLAVSDPRLLRARQDRPGGHPAGGRFALHRHRHGRVPDEPDLRQRP